MRKYNLGDIVLIKFPFTDSAKEKKRPALILLDLEDEDVILSRITSQDKYCEYDIEITEWQKCNLLLPSIIRLHKIATLNKNLIDKKLGKLTDNDLKNVKSSLNQLFKF
jgi:mRNA interferase MazF